MYVHIIYRQHLFEHARMALQEIFNNKTYVQLLKFSYLVGYF